ncbi:MAG: hypothetical protein HOI66_04195 [Verrucomicrobia bacterium]|nr:hypothetical protein [Verrucomicrobiota bacterium]
MIFRGLALSMLFAYTGLSQTLTHPIVFVTQTPEARDFTTIGSTFGNHLGEVGSAPRGGDLWIRYQDGTLKNLTEAAGFGESGFQGAQSIAVRDPAVHWDGEKVLFSMVMGSPVEQFEREEYYWQMYEVTRLGPDMTPVITRVPNQPSAYNNVSPIYASDDQIIFTTDCPRNGERHLYPQLDEYEEAPTVSGLWKLNPATGETTLLDHAPSGVFNPSIDSFGRVIFSRWDHLQRDQQADGDSESAGGGVYGTFNFTDESEEAGRLYGVRDEVFPEPRGSRSDLLSGTNLSGHNFNFFFPWMVNQDGTELETLNHIGRHELHDYFAAVFTDDERLTEFFMTPETRESQNHILNMFQIREDPLRPGVFFGVDAPEFQTHAAGMIFTLDGAPETNVEQMRVTYITAPESRNVAGANAAGHPGFFRNPLPTIGGTLLAVHTSESRADDNEGTRALPQSRYEFRIKTLQASGEHWVEGEPLTNGIVESLSWFDPDVRVTYEGPMWELSPVELRPRMRPEAKAVELGEPERLAFEEADVAIAQLKRFLVEEDLALVVSRDVTTRDDADQQQPYQLRVSGENGVSSVPEGGGSTYEISHLQFFQGDQIRGIGMHEVDDEPRPGRRVLAQAMHDESAMRYLPEEIFPGSVRLGMDGSMAAVVPAQRALSWQLLSPEGTPVIRERYWLTFQPGEIRTCTSCHGLNDRDQMGQTAPTNTPRALVELLGILKPSLGAGSSAAPLQIRDLGAEGVELRWMDVSGNAVLESTEGLNPASWQSIDESPEQSGDQRILRLVSGDRKRFFRLR